ncbi:16975_t:CDS:2 [Gigaspora margarita]|uniref:Uncharacterized protein n=2 Tax=Gigaspora margarita TaxID=4874 RepID=A0A8H3XF22_GIGMA|nr:hypothetical protein F8M41_002286 [Gigaspora margarita]CAG8633835.1 16975_t:CDS:2 [Gigaspora margarita]
MDYSISIANLNHSAIHFGSLNSTPSLPPNTTGRKRPRSNSMNKSDQAQKIARQFDENLDIEMNQPHETMAQLSLNTTRTQRYHHNRQTNKPCVVYTMGRRTDCERCLQRIPGHFAHVINH